MRYSSIRSMDISNGQGVGVSLFVQGCHFHCKGCFNQSTWDFKGGSEWTREVKFRFLNLVNNKNIQRVSILGGEPLADENVKDVQELISIIKVRYPDKKVWLYTGYTWEEIMEAVNSESRPRGENALRVHAALSADVVVDGRFDLDKQDLYNEKIVWGGSTNQRVINVEAMREQDCFDKIILLNDN